MLLCKDPWGALLLSITLSLMEGGGHIPPSSPSLEAAHQHSAGPNVNYSSFGAGSQGLPSYSMPVGSMLFSLFACIW
jgi:hypothetical protein